jgi:hypothetical protein
MLLEPGARRGAGRREILDQTPKTRMLTRVTSRPIRAASKWARRESSVRAMPTKWSRTRLVTCSELQRTWISRSEIATGAAPVPSSCRILWGTPNIGTTEPSENGTRCGSAASRAAIQPRFAAANRRPWLADTPRGSTSSTLRSAALIRSAIRRARRLTRIDTGVPSSSDAV